MHNGFLKFQEKQEKEREENKILLHVREETRMLVFVEIRGNSAWLDIST